MRKTMLLLAFLSACGLSACGDGESTQPCTSPNGACIEIVAGGDAYSRIQGALITARAGDVIHLGPGTYDMPIDLSLDVDGVTIRGAGMDKTVLTFKDQIEGAQGLMITSNDVTLEDFAVEDPRGDAIKFEGVTNVTVRRVRAEFTGGPLPTNGAYAIYPVQCTNVLVEDSYAAGASDTGIYVGQSENIIVRRNITTGNVAGIEIENSHHADVYENESYGNTAGILVFSLPGLLVKRGQHIRVFDNDIHDNNEANFAPMGNIVGKVPQGTGFAVIAAEDVEFFGNTVKDNQTANSAVVSYRLAFTEWGDPEYDPYPETVSFHDNTYIGGGNMPSEGLGFLIIEALLDTVGVPVVVPDMIIDGYRDPAHVGSDGELTAEYRFCAQNNGDADFADLDMPDDHTNVSLDLAPHDCSHPPVAPVVIPGVN